MAALLGSALPEAQSPTAVLWFGLELDFPSGTRRWCSEWVSSTALGSFEARIKSYGELPRAFSDRRGGMVSSDFSVTIDDTDQLFTKILGSRERIRNATARVKVLTPASSPTGVAPVLYWTGRLYDWTRGSDMGWTLNLRPNDVPLKQNFMRKIITPSVWPYAADDVRGAIAPIVLGRHDSSGLGTRNGALPTLNVKNNATPFERLVSWGWLSSVPHVYEGTTLITSGFTVEYVIRGGQRWTILSFTANPTGEIRVDANGVETVGDRTGTLIDKPTDILKWLAWNLWYGENTTGLWFGADVPETRINEATFDAVRDSAEFTRGANGQPYRASAYFNAERKPEDYIRDSCQSFRYNATWDVEGRLALRLLSSLASGTYPTTFFREPHEVDRIEIEYPAQDWIRRIVVRYGSQVGGDYIGSEELVEPLISDESSETLEQAAGAGFV